MYQGDYGNVRKWPGRPTGAGPKAVVGTCAFFSSPLVSTFKLFKTTYVHFSSVQSLSRVRLSATPWITARQASLSITNSQSSLRLTSIESVMSSSHLIFCHPLLLLLPIPPSIRVFSNESTLHMRWPKYWSFSLSISPSIVYPGLVSFRMDWLDLLVVQGTRKSSPAPQFKNNSSSVLSFLHSPPTRDQTHTPCIGGEVVTTGLPGKSLYYIWVHI